MRKIFLLLYFLIGISFLIGCHKIENPVSSAIAKEILYGQGTIIDVAKLTDFEWDKVHIFSPYFNKNNIHKIVGKKFLKQEEIPRGVSEGDTLFVFLKNKKVIHYFYHPRNKGDFSGIGNQNWFSPNNAKFKVIRDGRGFYRKWFKMKPLNFAESNSN